MEPPQTIEEARKFRYTKWAGKPEGVPWKEGLCAEQIFESGRGITHRQCSKKSGHGPEGLYCKEHARQFAPKTIWYSTFSGTISQVEIRDFSEEFVWVESGRKVARTSQYVSYFPTREEAKKWLIREAESRLRSAENALRWAREALAEVTEL